MHISRLQIVNLRAFKDETINLNRYTCFVGPNGSGKSTILFALNVFFRHAVEGQSMTTELSEEDFHRKNTKEPIRIVVTFSDLPESAQQDFSHYYRQKELTFEAYATWDSARSNAIVEHRANRNVIADFKVFFKKYDESELVPALKEVYEKIRETYRDLPPAGPKAGMHQALRQYEEGHPDKCELLPSKAQPYGYTGGGGKLEKYIQWVYVPAVKAAHTESSENKNAAIGKLLARTVRTKVDFSERLKSIRESVQGEYDKLLDESQGALKQISDTLSEKLKTWAHADTKVRLNWEASARDPVTLAQPLAQVKLSEGGGDSRFEGDLTRFGHGLQRCYIFALLQALAETEQSDAAPTLLLACEEPELYQHPPQARHLATILRKLSDENTQVLLCTHSPFFVSGRTYEDVRKVSLDQTDNKSVVHGASAQQVADKVKEARGDAASGNIQLGDISKLHQTLQPSLNEMFFARWIVLVEGQEDAAYLSTQFELDNKWGEFRRLGGHIVSVGGKSYLPTPVAISRDLAIPVFVLFDADGDQTDSVKRAAHEKDNKAIIALASTQSPPPFPNSPIWEPSLVIWPSNLANEVEKDFDAEKLRRAKEAAQVDHGHVGGLEKNALFIGTWIEKLHSSNQYSGTLRKLCDSILAFGRTA